MRVREVMNEQIETIPAEGTALEAAQKMRDGDFGALPVMDGRNVIGMVTDRDLAVRVIAEGLDPSEVPVEDIMTAEVVFCQADDSIDEAVDLMSERQIRRLIVMDEDKSICGILSLGDVALYEEDVAGDALSGISEKRHDEPAARQTEELNRH